MDNIYVALRPRKSFINLIHRGLYGRSVGKPLVFNAKEQIPRDLNCVNSLCLVGEQDKTLGHDGNLFWLAADARKAGVPISFLISDYGQKEPAGIHDMFDFVLDTRDLPVQYAVSKMRTFLQERGRYSIRAFEQ